MRMDKCYTTQWANTVGRTTFTEQDSQGTHSRTLYIKVTCFQIQWPLIPFHIELCLLPAKGENVDSRWTVYASFNRYCSLEKGHCLFFLRSNSGCGEQKHFGLVPGIIYKGTDRLRWKHTGWALLSPGIQHTTGAAVLPLPGSAPWSLPLLEPRYALLTNYPALPKYIKTHSVLVLMYMANIYTPKPFIKPYS